MASDDGGLGGLIGTYAAKGGFTGFQNRRPVRNTFLTAAGFFVGLIPGLFVALVADLWPAIIIGGLLGAIGGYFWASRLNFDAAVTEARLHQEGVVFVDPRGTHALTWDQIASIEGKHMQTVLGTGIAGIGDTKGVTQHSYLLRTRDGTGFWLDDRITNVVTLADAIVRASGVSMTPMP